jgi:hypothetical protein
MEFVGINADNTYSFKCRHNDVLRMMYKCKIGQLNTRFIEFVENKYSNDNLNILYINLYSIQTSFKCGSLYYFTIKYINKMPFIDCVWNFINNISYIPECIITDNIITKNMTVNGCMTNFDIHKLKKNERSYNDSVFYNTYQSVIKNKSQYTGSQFKNIKNFHKNCIYKINKEHNTSESDNEKKESDNTDNSGDDNIGDINNDNY